MRNRPGAATGLAAGHFTMSGRSKRSPGTSDILHLISIGTVGAATVTLFSLASVSLLGTGHERASSHGDGGVFRYADDNSGPIPPQTDSPALASVKLPLVPAQAQSTPETPNVSDAKGFERPSPDDDASTATSAAARKPGGPPITNTQSTEVGGSNQSPTERRPIGEEVTAAHFSQQTVRTEIPDDARDQAFRNVEIPPNQPAKLEQDDLSSDRKAPRQKGQKQRADLHLLGPSAAFRFRVRKECGSIIFPALYRHCVASLGPHYR